MWGLRESDEAGPLKLGYTKSKSLKAPVLLIILLFVCLVGFELAHRGARWPTSWRHAAYDQWPQPMPIVVNLGFPKSGSTSLRAFLDKAYVAAGTRYRACHWKLRASIFGKGQYVCELMRRSRFFGLDRNGEPFGSTALKEAYCRSITQADCEEPPQHAFFPQIQQLDRLMYELPEAHYVRSLHVLSPRFVNNSVSQVAKGIRKVLITRNYPDWRDSMHAWEPPHRALFGQEGQRFDRRLMKANLPNLPSVASESQFRKFHGEHHARVRELAKQTGVKFFEMDLYNSSAGTDLAKFLGFPPEAASFWGRTNLKKNWGRS